RAQRDAAELFEDGGDTIKLGPRHRFSVNRQELDLTALPRGDTLCLHLIGTDYFEPIDDAALQAPRPYWNRGSHRNQPSWHAPSIWPSASSERPRPGATGSRSTRCMRRVSNPAASSPCCDVSPNRATAKATSAACTTTTPRASPGP